MIAVSSAASTEDVSEDLSVILEYDTLQQTLDSLLAIADECRMHLGRDGLDVKLVDRANVAMTIIDLDPSAFESVGDGQIVFGVNLQRLDDYLKHATSGDLIQLGYKEETRFLNIQYGSVDVDMALIDTQSIREEPSLPDVDLPAKFETTGRALDDAVSLADLASDHITLTADPEQEEVRIVGEGDYDTVTTRFTREELTEAQIPAAAKGIYSLDYVKDLAGPIPAAAEVFVEYETERPLWMSYGIDDGHGEVQTMLAPRVQDQ